MRGEMNTPSIETIDEAPDADLQNILLSLLNEDNRKRSSIVDFSDVAVVLRDAHDRAVLGGLWAEDDFAWIFVKYLIVPEPLRGRGLGARLMQEVEAVARRRGRVGVWLNTFDFQSRAFYEKIGYQLFGRLEGADSQSGQSFLRKAL